jgi:hypothetical protein
MQIFGIPRLDPGAEGIHLVWTWPDTLPISEKGFDIQRLEGKEQRWRSQCEDIDSRLIAYLRGHNVYPAPLGPLRMQTGVRFTTITDSSLLAPGPDNGVHPRGFGNPTSTMVETSLRAVLASSSLRTNTINLELDVFIQELNEPVERASVEAAGRVAISVAMYQGKAVQVVPGGVLPATMQLQAPAIDTILVYIVSPQSLRICVYTRPTVKGVDEQWSGAPYIVRGLTLPIHETDPILATPGLEYAAATSRLVRGEALSQADFQKLTATLRGPARAATLGRSGERIFLRLRSTLKTGVSSVSDIATTGVLCTATCTCTALQHDAALKILRITSTMSIASLLQPHYRRHFPSAT